MTSLSEKIDNILERFRDYHEGYEEGEIEFSMDYEEAKLAIMTAIEECLPCEYTIGKLTHYEIGYNACRNAMIERLK